MPFQINLSAPSPVYPCVVPLVILDGRSAALAESR